MLPASIRDRKQLKILSYFLGGEIEKFVFEINE